MPRPKPSADPPDVGPESAVWPETVVGGKYVRLLQKLLDQLREQDSHGNQRLFLDDVFVVHLLAFFNPSIRSLRTIEDFSKSAQARRHLSITRLCRSTLSDFHKLVDPQRLEPILHMLRREVGRKRLNQRKPESDLETLLQRTVAVDGTFLPACAKVAWAVRSANQRRDSCGYKARLDFEVRAEDGLPEVVVVPHEGQSEADSAQSRIQPGQVRLYDRGYSGFGLINAHYRESDEQPVPIAHFVIRYRSAGSNTPSLAEAREQPLSQADRDAGVVSDRVGVFCSSKQSRHQILDVPLREVIVERVHQGKTDQIRLITNLFGVSAEVIAQLYRHRWRIELFFRWLKCFGNFAHLLSYSASGVQMQFYVAVIAAMLMYLHTGFRPSKYLFAMLSLVAAGGCGFEEILPILHERERQSELARQSAARRRARHKG